MVSCVTPHLENVGYDSHTQDRQEAIFKWRSFDYVRVKMEKFHDATEEDGASSNIPRVCIQDKLRCTQDSREWGDTSVEDKLEESELGRDPYNLKSRSFDMNFDIWLWN